MSSCDATAALHLWGHTVGLVCGGCDGELHRATWRPDDYDMSAGVRRSAIEWFVYWEAESVPGTVVRAVAS